MQRKVFTYIWEFIVKDSEQKAFEKAYGPEGDWVMLFRKSQGYLGTELHQDQSNPLRYLTLDYWRSKEDRDTFRLQFAHEFQQLDARCEKYAVQEKFLGDYDGFTSRAPSAEQASAVRGISKPFR